MSRRRIARGEGVAEFLRFDADGGEHGRLSRIWRLVAARVVDGCRVRDFGWWLDRFGGCPGPRYYQCPTFHPPVPCDRGACARRASVSSCRLVVLAAYILAALAIGWSLDFALGGLSLSAQQVIFGPLAVTAIVLAILDKLLWLGAVFVALPSANLLLGMIPLILFTIGVMIYGGAP